MKGENREEYCSGLHGAFFCLLSCGLTPKSDVYLPLTVYNQVLSSLN